MDEEEVVDAILYDQILEDGFRLLYPDEESEED